MNASSLPHGISRFRSRSVRLPDKTDLASACPAADVAAVSALAAGVHQATGAASASAAAASVASAASSAAPLFSPASGGPRAQVKEGIGPKLPRPNRVRVPTRRELASYGIKLPSQRLAEERARQAEHQHYEDDALTDEEVAELEQGELARRSRLRKISAMEIATLRKRMMETKILPLKPNLPVSLPLPSSSATPASSHRDRIRSLRRIMNSHQ